MTDKQFYELCGIIMLHGAVIADSQLLFAVSGVAFAISLAQKRQDRCESCSHPTTPKPPND
jgi:hypothetical protein